MTFDQCFTALLPPTTETFSFRALPCPVEEGDALAAPPLGSRDCSFQTYCAESRRSLGFRLQSAYSPFGDNLGMKVSLSEPSSSIVVRSEHQYNKDDRRRLSLRKHFYEVLSACDRTSCGVECPPIRADDRFGEYVGFVDMRLQSPSSPIAMALLAPPRRFREDRSTFVSTGEFGPLFGGPAFPCTVYSMQDPELGGARCAQACVIMALASLANRGARVAGSYALTYLAQRHKEDTDALGGVSILNGDVNAPPPVAPVVEGATGKTYQISGLTPDECEYLLGEHNTSPKAYKFDLSTNLGLPAEYLRGGQNLLILRLIQAYVFARLPVILFVDSKAWGFNEPQQDEGHAVVVTGIRNASYLQKASLVIHDPGDCPYRECPVQDCLAAAWAYPLPPKIDGGQDVAQVVNLVVAGDQRIKRHAKECLEELLNAGGDDEEEIAGFMTDPQSDYQISLLHRADVSHIFTPPTNSLEVQTWNFNELSNLPPVRYWCISGYRRGSIHLVWMFNAELSGAGTYSALFEVDANGFFHILHRQSPGHGIHI